MTSYFDVSNNQSTHLLEALIPRDESVLWHGKLRPIRYVRRMYATTAALPVAATVAVIKAGSLFYLHWWIVGYVAVIFGLLWLVVPMQIMGLTRAQYIRVAITDAAVYVIDVHKRVVRNRNSLGSIPIVKRICWHDGGGDIFSSAAQIPMKHISVTSTLSASKTYLTSSVYCLRQLWGARNPVPPEICKTSVTAHVPQRHALAKKGGDPQIDTK